MLALICPRCGRVMDEFPRCGCGRSVPCEGGVYQFTRQPSANLTGPGPHYLGYGSWGRASATQDYYHVCSARLAELLGEEWCVDVGTGYGQVPLQLAAAGGHTLAVDISNTALRALRARSVAVGAEEKVLCARMDAYHLALADGCAFVVLLNNIFPMLDRPELALREAARVLRPDGRMVLYGRRITECGESAAYREAEQTLFAAFDSCLARWGWGRVWFGPTGVGDCYPQFRPPVCLSAGPPAERTEQLGQKLRRLEENGFNRYQHVPRTVYRRAWAAARERVRRIFGPGYERLECRRVEEPVLYLYQVEGGV